MNKVLFICVFGASLAAAMAQESPSFVPRAEPMCGLCSAWHTYLEEGHVHNGLAVDMLVGPGQVNQPLTLRFFVCQKPSNWPEDGLEIEHEKYMHVIGVRDDLKDFFHIHPVKTGPGLWTVNYIFTNGGNYKIWTDVRWQNVSYTASHPMLHINGERDVYGEAHDFSDSVVVSGYRVTLKHSETLTAGQTNQLLFSIQDAAGKSAEIGNFLGVPMHLVMVKEDLSAYVHAHPDAAMAGNSIIHFSPIFPADGVYKLFAQFRPVQANLLPDDSICAEFYLKVEKAQHGLPL